jgi:signal transduction histidine kinase/DNA-binding NarL/FixJ family response regulator/HPt (histidine-containing phosphotransfer) domain-containing protein
MGWTGQDTLEGLAHEEVGGGVVRVTVEGVREVDVGRSLGLERCREVLDDRAPGVGPRLARPRAVDLDASGSARRVGAGRPPTAPVGPATLERRQRHVREVREVPVGVAQEVDARLVEAERGERLHGLALSLVPVAAAAEIAVREHVDVDLGSLRKRRGEGLAGHEDLVVGVRGHDPHARRAGRGLDQDGPGATRPLAREQDEQQAGDRGGRPGPSSSARAIMASMVGPSLLGIAALAAVAVYLGVHHAILAPRALEHERRLHRLVALWCGGTFSFLLSRGLHYATDDALVAVWALRAEFVVVAGVVGLLFATLLELVGRRGQRWAGAGFLLALLLLLAAPLGVSLETYRWSDALGHTIWWAVVPSPVPEVLAALAIVAAVGGIALLTRAERLETGTRRVLVVAFVAYFALGLHDLFLLRWGFRTVPLFEYGFVGLAVVFDYLSVRRFHQLYASLERAVEARTAEIQTARRTLEATNRALGATNAELESANAKLAVALERAERTTHERTEFVARVSHEIRTPLHGLVGTADLLASSRLDASQARLVGALQASGERLRALVDEVLDFTRLDAGHIELVPGPFDPVALVEGLAAQLRAQAERKGLELRVVRGVDAPPVVVADALRVEQILANFVGNAIKFTEQGAVELEVRGEGEQLAVAVRDTGIGIARDRLAAVFEPFVQGGPETFHRYGGTGLGLTIARRLAEAMGGGVEVASELGAGSTFTLRIPRGEAASAPLPQPLLARRWALAASRPATPPLDAHADREGAAVLEPAARGRVLVADDDEVNRLLLASMVGRLGLEAEVAKDGLEALALATARLGGEEAPYAALLLDCHMPQLDGWQAIARVRALEEELGARRTPAFAVSAGLSPQERARALRDGFDGFLDKPIDGERLRALLGAREEAAAPAAWAPEASGEREGLLDPAVIDDLAAMAAADASIAPELLAAFERAVPRHLDALRRAQGPVDRRWHAHALVGACRTVGALAMATTASAIERAPADGHGLRVDAIEALWPVTVAALRARLVERRGAA